MAQSSVDAGVQQSIATKMSDEASAAGASRLRAWDAIMLSITGAQVNYVNAPSVLAGQGIRMLQGTPTMAPGNAPNANVNNPLTG